MSLLLNRAMGLPLLLARRRRPRAACDNPRILVIRRNRMGDMICTLPVLRALRDHYPAARITVACDKPGAPIARACPAVDRTVVLDATWTRRLPPVFNAGRLQNHDWVIVAKGGFDKRLATLSMLAHAAIRVGFDPAAPGKSDYYTHPVALPENAHSEHQIETLLRLLAPLDIPAARFEPSMLQLNLPGTALQFARTIFASGPFAEAPAFALINLSSNRRFPFSMDDYAVVVGHLLEQTPLAIGLVGVPSDRLLADNLARRFPGGRVASIPTAGPLALAALLERAALFLTPEGGAGHLSSCMLTPTVVLFHGPLGKWRPRGPRHVVVEAESPGGMISASQVCEALDSLLAQARG